MSVSRIVQIIAAVARAKNMVSRMVENAAKFLRTSVDVRSGGHLASRCAGSKPTERSKNLAACVLPVSLIYVAQF